MGEGQDMYVPDLRTLIRIYKNADPSEVSREGFIDHEMGHAFAKDVDPDYSGWGITANFISDELSYRECDGTENCGIAGPVFEIFQWSRKEGPRYKNEIFADMFVGWVFDQWEHNEEFPEGVDKGRERANLMNTNMGIWIYDAVVRHNPSLGMIVDMSKIFGQGSPIFIP